MNIIQTSEISKHYAGHTALDRINISIPENAVFGLLGPNGAGKTSFIRILTHIIAPDEGQILYKGQKLTAAHISQMGYLPEERGLYKKMKVGEHLIYLARLKGLSLKEAQSRLEEWLSKMDLLKWKDNFIQDLSKGMQQKVQFVATIMHNPRLIIFDEPFSGFDPINAALIKNHILEFKKQGATIILSTHRMESVEELCDHIALIHRAKKIMDGSVKEMKQSFKTGTYIFEGKGHLLPKDVISIVKEERQADIVKLWVKPQKNISANELLKYVAEEDTLTIHSFKEEVPSMHDLFMLKVKEADE